MLIGTLKYGVFEEKPLNDFKFWGISKVLVSLLTKDEMDIIEEHLKKAFPEGMKRKDINDFFWFDFDIVAELLGFTVEQICNRVK